MTRKKGVYHELRLGAGEGTIRDDIWGTDKVPVLQTFTRIHGRKPEVSLHPALPFACPQKAGGPNLKKYFPLPPQISLRGARGVCSEWKKTPIQDEFSYFSQNIATSRKFPYVRKIWLGENIIPFDPYFWSEKKNQPKATEPTHRCLFVHKALEDAEKVTEFSVFFCETSIRWYIQEILSWGIHGSMGYWYSWNFGRWKSFFCFDNNVAVNLHGLSFSQKRTTPCWRIYQPSNVSSWYIWYVRVCPLF